MLNLRSRCRVPSSELLQKFVWKKESILFGKKCSPLGDVHISQEKTSSAVGVIKGKVNNFIYSLNNDPESNRSLILKNESRCFLLHSVPLKPRINFLCEEVKKLKTLFYERYTLNNHYLNDRLAHTNSYKSIKPTVPARKKNKSFCINDVDKENVTIGEILSDRRDIDENYSLVNGVFSDSFRYSSYPTYMTDPDGKKSNNEMYYSFEKKETSTKQRVDGNKFNEANVSVKHIKPLDQFSYLNKNYQHHNANKSLSKKNSEKRNSNLGRKFTVVRSVDTSSLNNKENIVNVCKKNKKLYAVNRKKIAFDSVEQNFKNTVSEPSVKCNDYKEKMLATDTNKSNITEKTIDPDRLPANNSDNPMSILHIINSIDKSEAIIHKDLYITNKVIEEMETNKKKKPDVKPKDSKKMKLDMNNVNLGTVVEELDIPAMIEKDKLLINFDTNTAKTFDNKVPLTLNSSESTQNESNSDNHLHPMTIVSVDEKLLKNTSYLYCSLNNTDNLYKTDVEKQQRPNDVYKTEESCIEKIPKKKIDSLEESNKNLNEELASKINFSQELPPSLVDNAAINLRNPLKKDIHSLNKKAYSTGGPSDNTLDVITETNIYCGKNGKQIKLKLHEIQTFKDKRLPFTFITDTTMQMQGSNEKLQAANEIVEVAKAKLVLTNAKRDPVNKPEIDSTAKLTELFSYLKHRISTDRDAKKIPIQIEPSADDKTNPSPFEVDKRNRYTKHEYTKPSKTVSLEDKEKLKDRSPTKSKLTKNENNSEFNIIKLGSEELGKLLNSKGESEAIKNRTRNKYKPESLEKKVGLSKNAVNNSKDENLSSSKEKKNDKRSDKSMMEIKPVIRNASQSGKRSKLYKQTADKKKQQLYKDEKVPTNKLSQRDLEIINKLKKVTTQKKLIANNTNENKENIKSGEPKDSAANKLETSKTIDENRMKKIKERVPIYKKINPRSRPRTYEIIKIKVRETEPMKHNLSTIGRIVKTMDADKKNTIPVSEKISTVGKIFNKVREAFESQKEKISERIGIDKAEHQIKDNFSTVDRVIKSKDANKEGITSATENISTVGKVVDYLKEDKQVLKTSERIARDLVKDKSGSQKETAEPVRPLVGYNIEMLESKDANKESITSATENISTVGKVFNYLKDGTIEDKQVLKTSQRIARDLVKDKSGSQVENAEPVRPLVGYNIEKELMSLKKGSSEIDSNVLKDYTGKLEKQEIRGNKEVDHLNVKDSSSLKEKALSKTVAANTDSEKYSVDRKAVDYLNIKVSNIDSPQTKTVPDDIHLDISHNVKKDDQKDLSMVDSYYKKTVEHVIKKETELKSDSNINAKIEKNKLEPSDTNAQIVVKADNNLIKERLSEEVEKTRSFLKKYKSNLFKSLKQEEVNEQPEKTVEWRKDVTSRKESEEKKKIMADSAAAIPKKESSSLPRANINQPAAIPPPVVPSFVDKNLEKQISFAEALQIDLDKTFKEIKPSLDYYSSPKRSVVSTDSLLGFPLVNEKKKMFESPPGIICIDCKKNVVLRQQLRKIPSVTRILNATMSDSSRIALAKWRSKMITQLGEAGFQEFYKGQLKTGSDFHETLQMYFRGGLHDLYKSSNPALRSISHISNHITDVKVVESHVVHQQLAYRGIIDCVAKYKNVPVLIEWKRSDKKKMVIENTFDAPLQLCAYIGAMSFDNNYPLQIDGGLVIVAYSDGSPADVFSLPMAECDKYWKLWLQRLKQYMEDGAGSSVLPKI